MNEPALLIEPSFQAQWEHYRQRANTRLSEELSRLPEGGQQQLARAMRYSTQNGGKRFRAMLVYASGQCFGASIESLDTSAVALELMHAYSLVHDDLPAMDDDDMRRGQASCHVKFDEATAILAGDALQTLAFELLARPCPHLDNGQQLKIISRLAHASGVWGMANGQSLDIDATGQALDQAALQNIHEQKTGALIRAALAMGALSANDVSEQELAHLDEYGRLIGLAFQVVDDILDETQTSEQLGKQSGADAAMDKNTYPALLGLTSARKHAQQLVNSAQQSLGKLGRNTDFLSQLAAFTLQRDH